MKPKYFEDFKEGEDFETPARTITDCDIIAFAGVSGDFYSLHTDDEFAKKSIFGKRVAHGLLTLSIAEGLWMRTGIYEGTLVAFYGIDNLRFIKPVFPGDTIKVRISVNQKRDKGKYGLVTFHNEVINQNGEVVLIFDALILMAKRNPR